MPEAAKSSARRGIVYLLGAGPGDEDLITLRGRKLIETCDVLVFDYLACPTMRKWTKPGCEQIDVGKRPGRHAVEQERIQDILVEHAQQGKSVVRLKGGDPLLFGRGGEEAVRLREAGVPFEIVPGVTAALACAAYAGVPLTHRELSSSVCFLTGHEDVKKERMRVDFRKFAQTGDTLCIYMGMGHLAEIVSELLAGGLPGDTPAAIVQWATLPRQRSAYGELAQLPQLAEEAKLGAPAVVIVGTVAKMHPEVSWFEQRPLFGKRVVVTRNQAQAGGLTAALKETGAEVLELPLIDVRLGFSDVAAEEILGGIATYEWIIFTSPNGVEGFFNAFYERYSDLRCLGPMRVACVGEGTARAVRAQRLEVDVIPDEATGKALGEKLTAEHSLENLNVLLVTGNRNSPELAHHLEGPGGAIVDTFEVYQTSLRDLSEDPAAEDFRQRGADALLFASSSAAESFAQQAANLQPGADARFPKAYSIGPRTSEAMRKAGIPIEAEAHTHTPDGLVQLLLEKLG